MPTPVTPLTDAFVADVRTTFADPKLEVRFVYNGAGDDGWFDDWTINFPDDNLSSWHAEHVESKGGISWNGDPMPPSTVERAAKMIALRNRHDISAIYRELGVILCKRYPGWEIDDGGSGAFVFKADGTRKHEHTTNVTTYEDEEQPF
jgi:hypothetical protein